MSREFLAELARHSPLLPGAETLAFIDIDSMQKRVYGHQKQGAKFGHTKIQGEVAAAVRGLNALAAVISTPLSAPVIAGDPAARRERGLRARRGQPRRPRHRHRPGRRADGGMIIVRADSAYYTAEVIAAIRRGGARFSVTVPVNSKVQAAIAAIPEGAWTPIRYPRAIFDDQLGAWVSDAEVAGTQYTAFAYDKDKAVSARLIVRRVRDLNKKAGAGQGELFPVWRYHAAFTDSPFELVQAEGHHRDHAVVEQVFADVTSGPLAHLPSGVFTANAAWLAIAAGRTNRCVRGRQEHLASPPRNQGRITGTVSTLPKRSEPTSAAAGSQRPHRRREPEDPEEARTRTPPVAAETHRPGIDSRDQTRTAALRERRKLRACSCRRLGRQQWNRVIRKTCPPLLLSPASPGSGQ